MNKKMLIDSIMARSGKVIPRSHVEVLLQGLTAAIQSELSGCGDFVLPGVGRLQVVTRKARSGRNPRTGAVVDIPVRRTVRLRPAKALRDVL